MLNEIAKKAGKIQKIMFRIKPGVDAHTHSFIQTGQIDSKFGVALENGEAFEIIKYATTLENVKVTGVHCHIGSQIFDIEPFMKAAEIMMNFIGDLKDKLGLEIEELNLGGGYGIMYTENDDPIEYDEYIKHVSEKVKEVADKRGVKLPFIFMEPGRSIVASAGITLYTVGCVKDIKNVRKRGTEKSTTTPWNIESGTYSFPAVFCIIGNVVSIDVAPPEEIGASFPKNLTINGANAMVISSLNILAANAIVPISAPLASLRNMLDNE